MCKSSQLPSSFRKSYELRVRPSLTMCDKSNTHPNGYAYSIKSWPSLPRLPKLPSIKISINQSIWYLRVPQTPSLSFYTQEGNLTIQGRENSLSSLQSFLNIHVSLLPLPSFSSIPSHNRIIQSFRHHHYFLMSIINIIGAHISNQLQVQASTIGHPPWALMIFSTVKQSTNSKHFDYNGGIPIIIRASSHSHSIYFSDDRNQPEVSATRSKKFRT